MLTTDKQLSPRDEIAYWTSVCQSCSRTAHIKRAEAGQTIPFEQAMSNLAYAYLKDRAPQLLDYQLGFQLLEKNEDNDRAVGVFGFKVGPQLLYAPVFFLNGELKGHELLYLKESDTFVPLTENWINYILHRKPVVLGEEVGSNLSAIGAATPRMDTFRETPTKYAAAEPWLQAGLPGLMYALDRHEAVESSVPALVKQSGEMAMRMLTLMDARPELGQAIVRCYGKDMIKSAIA